MTSMQSPAKAVRGALALAVFLLVVSAHATVHAPRANVPTNPARCGAGEPNPYPVNTVPPVFVSQVPNGKRYLAGQGNDTFYVAHLWGTPYEKGYALGSLFASDIKGMLAGLDKFIAEELLSVVPWLPKVIADIIAKDGGYVALQYIWDLDKSEMKAKYVEEIDGIAAGAGVAVERIQNANMLPELTKAACTIFGAYNNATRNGVGQGGIAHLRALDFVVNAPLLNFPAVTIYHNAEGPSLANFGWLGMTGVLTAITSERRGVGEKLWGGPHHEGWISGEPWMYILRDLMEMPGHFPDIIRRIETANKTTDIHIGIGNQADNLFLGFELAPNYTKIFNATTFPSSQYHPDYPDVVYWEKNLGAKTYCYADLLQQRYGSISAEFLARTLSPMAMTGETHMATFDYHSLTAYFSNCRKTTVTAGPAQAYARQITQLDLDVMFRESRP